MKHPPITTPPHPNLENRVLSIIEGIASEDGRGAQVVKCCFGDDENTTYVAKIYDPLYYSYVDREMGIPVDVTWVADKDYSRESAAYEELQKSQVDGYYAPTYHGSWTFEMSLPGEPRTTRPVRMILMEWIQGINMWSLIESKQTYSIPPQQRLDILAEAMEVEAKVNFYGVKHGDFAPRNIILVGANLKQELPKVFLVDFNKSVVYDQPNCRYPRSSTHLPINPQYRHWGSCDPEFVNWVPEPHRSRPLVYKGWLRKQWDGSKNFASREEGRIRDFDYDEEVEIVPPEKDREPEDPVMKLARLIQP